MGIMVALSGCASTKPTDGGAQPAAAKTDAPAPVKKLKLTLGTAAPGGVWYVLGAGFADLWSREVAGVEAVAESTAGANENPRLVARNQLDIGLTNPGVIKSEVEKGTFGKEQIFILAAGHGGLSHLVVRKDSNIQKFTDLKGKRVGMGEPGSGVQVQSKLGLQLHGMTEADVQSMPLGYEEMVDALKNKRTDAVFLNGGPPVAAVIEAATSVGVRIVPYDEAALAKLDSDPNATYGSFTIPKGTYPGQDQDVRTTGSPAIMFARAGIDEEVVYNLLKSLYGNTASLVKVHSAASDWTLQTALNGRALFTKLGVQYHPGAIKFYREMGVWK